MIASGDTLVVPRKIINSLSIDRQGWKYHHILMRHHFHYNLYKAFKMFVIEDRHKTHVQNVRAACDVCTRQTYGHRFSA